MKAISSIAFNDFSWSSGNVTARNTSGGTILSVRPIPCKICSQSQRAKRNTIAVEKVTAWDDNDTITLVFSNSYVPRNIRGPVTRLKWNIADTTDITGGTASNGQTYWTATDEWVFLGIALSRLEQADAGTQVSFKIRGLPEMEDFDGILMDDQAISPSVGTRMLRFHIRDNVFTVEPIHPDRSWHYMQYCGFICYVPRKRVADE